MKTLATLLLTLTLALPSLAAVWPAGTNTANQTFFGNNNFLGSLKQNGVDVLTNAAGGSQTPIVSDINYAGHSATNIGSLSAASMSLTTLNVSGTLSAGTLVANLASSTNLPGASVAGGFTNLVGQAAPAQIQGTLSNSITGNAATATATSQNTFTNLIKYGDSYRTNASWIDANGDVVCSNALGIVTASSGKLTASGTVLAQNFDTPTNAWTANTAFPLGTNTFYTSGAATFGFTSVANGPTSTERYGQMTVKTTGTVVLTNIPSIYFSDGLTNRTITNGNTAVIAMDVVPGQVTNAAIVQFWHP